MKVSILTNSKGSLHTTSKDYLRVAKQWFLRTPERALNQAYNAALAIKSIEDEHFNGNKISADNNHPDNVVSYLQADIEKKLSIVQMRLAEFKASRSVIGISNFAHLQKSIGRTVTKVKRELNPEAEAEFIKKFRSSRTKKKTAIRFNLGLDVVTIITQQISKQFLISPIIAQMRHGDENQIFLALR